uniref:URB1 N-terminal domain-containing protein n=1 Tax=Physcomitrium patens TaxID=3218 RepID=A0A7I4D817_PHYPA
MAAEEVQELQRNNELEDMEMVEEDGGEGFMITEQLDEETQNLAAGLASRQSDELMHALHEFLKVLAVPKRGGKVLRQYVLASPKCVELLSAWELGSGAPTAVPLMLLLSEIFRHPQGKGRTNRVDDRKVRGNSVEALQKAKALAVVQSRLDKLARTFGRSKIKDMYSHLSSKQRSRQKAVLRLLSSIVLRGKLLAVDVATNFDFTLEALKKLAQHPFKASANTKTQGLLHQSTRYYFIEFALSFLVVGDPGLLRWILQKRPLYAGLLHGLAKDEEATIIQVLHVFQEKVMAPASLVPAGLQSVLFGDVALEQLARIAGDELFRESADVAYETLMALCTDPSHGLCPEYASPWESVNFKSGAHGGNQGRLLRLLLRLRVTEAFRHRELLLTTARLRPRLAAAYLDAVPYSLEPRPSPTWFTIMSLVADLVHISSTPPPLSSMALRGLPVPAPDGPLVRNNLRHLLPRALPKVALNRGLQHANVLVKHASLRLLLEALLSLELLVDGAFAAAENTCSQLKDRFSGNFSVLETKTRSIKRGDSLRDSEQEFQRRQWLELVESIQDTMRATLPDPNILLIINSTINRRKNSLDEPDGNHKRTQPVKEVSAGKRRKKDEGYVIDEPDRTQLSHSDSSVESEGDEEEEDSSALEILAQIWGSEAIVSANGSIQSLLHAKLLEVLAAYQRVLPVAFADKGFDPFKLLSSDLMQLSLAQQKAFLSLLLATTAASQRNSATNSIVEAGGFGSVYKHSKPLLKMMIGCRVDHIRDNAHLLASRLMVSTGAFESNTWETTLWLGHLSRLIGEPVNTICKLDDSEEDHPNQHILGSIGECVVGFLAEAVSSVGRTLYKYFDELFSLLSAHSLGEGSTEQSKGLSGSMVPEFGPFVVCALEHTLRVVRSDSKSMSLPQRSAIALYVAGVLSDLLRIQTDARALGIVITSILSPEFNPTTRNTDKNLSTLGSEWNPLQVVYLQARSFLDGEVNWATPAMQAPGLKISEPSGHLCDVITTCKESTKDDVVMLKENLVSALVCAPLHNVSNSFFKLVEIIPKTCGQRIPILMTLCGLHCSLLTEADLEFENTEKDRTIKRQLLVTELLSIFSSSSFKMGGLALSDSSSSIGELANHIFYFLKSLPFSVLFSALLYRVNGKLLNFEVLSTTLDSSYSSILAHDQLIIMKTLLSSIHQLSFASLESLDKKQRLDICFTYLKRLVTIPKTSNHGEESNTISEEILLCKDMIIMSLTHPAIAGFCQCSTETEVSSMKHQKSSRLLDACIMDYLKFLLESCSAIELRGKSESLAEMLDSLQGATIQACKPFVQKTMKLFSLKLIGRVSDEDETTFSKDYYLTQSFVLQLAGYADSQYFLSFLSDLVSCKTVRTPSGVSSSSVFLELARAFYEKRLQNGLNNKFKSEHCGAVLQESLDVFRFVGTEVLKDVAEDADRCLLSALQSFSPDAEGGCSSSSSHLSLLVSTAPIEVINCCIQRPTILRGNIVKILVQTSTVHRNEFGRLLCQGTGEDEIENDEASKFASKFLTEKKFQTEKTSFRLSDNDLFLLLPAAKVFLCKCQSSLMTRLVVHVASTYLRLLTTHIKRWDEFVLKLLSFTELGSSVSKLVNKDHSVEELAGSYFKDIVTLMRRCLAICPLSSKKRVYLLRKLLPKAGLPLADLQIDSLIGSEIDLSTVFFQVYGKAAAARHILSDIEAHLPEAYTASSVPKQQKLRSLMADSVMRFATGLASTLTVIFKVAAQMKNQSTSSYTPRTPKVIKALEEFLQLQLVGVVKSIDTTGFEADIMSLFESYAKTCLRYKFGNVEGMKVLQALAGCLLNLPDDYTAKRREIVSSVLELVLSHSQFVLYIVSCSTASRPLPKNLGRQAGKGTALSSLPSILSLIGSPMVVSGKQTLGVASDMQVSSMSEAEGADIDVGIDAPAEVPEECQLALLQLVRSLFQVKMHPGDEILSSEDRATVEELLSLLLAAYGATTGRLDTEIYALMKQLESYGGPGFSGLASMDYLWGEAALQRRKAKVEEKSQLMDEGLEIDENVLESRKRTYKEDLTLDPRRCGLSVLCFPTLAHHSITLGNREVGAKSKKVFLSDTYDADLELQLKGTAYDPRYILQFGLHGIAVKCIDAEEFVCLGLLAVAIASLSSSDEDMRRLGYKLLAKYMSILEVHNIFLC